MRAGLAALCVVGAMVSVMVVAAAGRADAYALQFGTLNRMSFASIAAAPGGGVWTQPDNGGSSPTRALYGAPDLTGQGTAKAGNNESVQQITNLPGALAATPDGGYYVVGTTGNIARYSPHGTAAQWSRSDLIAAGYTKKSASGCPAGHVAAAAVTPTGNGMWVMDGFGFVYTLGDAHYYGEHLLSPSCVPLGGGSSQPGPRTKSGQPALSQQPERSTGFAVTPGGLGYYVVTSYGSVYTFGNAQPNGAFPQPGPSPITGIALVIPPVNARPGYYLVSQDGSVYPFGPYTPIPWGQATNPNETDVTNITLLANQSGYALVRTNGDAFVYTFPTEVGGTPTPPSCPTGVGLTRHPLPPTAKACNRPHH